MRRFILTATALLLVPTQASAQSCYTLDSDRRAINREAGALARENPGSAIVFGGCVAAGSSEYEQTGSHGSALAAFAVCAAVGCAVTDSYRNCLSVGRQLFTYALQVIDLEDRMRRQRC